MMKISPYEIQTTPDFLLVPACSSSLQQRHACGPVVSWQRVSNRTYLKATPPFFMITGEIVGHAGTTTFTDPNGVDMGRIFTALELKPNFVAAVATRSTAMGTFAGTFHASKCRSVYVG